MSGAAPPDSAAERGSYFYLSYAHSPPLAGGRQTDPDQWVRRFFGDLTAAVARHAGQEPRLEPGFFDQEIPLGSDPKAVLNRALSTAEVFVPLYSPSYFTRSWPGKEYACFRERLRRSGLADPVGRLAPVLWIPLPRNRDWPGMSKAMAVGGAEQAYRENGLRALLRLTPYQASYEVVVDRLAAQIVDLAETTPLRPSAAPDIDTVESAFRPEDSGAVFTVTVAAPSAPKLPAGQDLAGYGAASQDWRPFPERQELPLAAYAVQVAEQLLDFAVPVTGLDEAADLNRWPGVILVDPQLAVDQRRLDTLRSLTAGLRPWVIPVLVFGSHSGIAARDLADQIRVGFGPAQRQTQPSQRAIRGVSSLQEFVDLMPILVAEAERQYLRHGSAGQPRPRSGSRPPLIGGRPPAGINAMSHRVKETPNA